IMLLGSTLALAPGCIPADPAVAGADRDPFDSDQEPLDPEGEATDADEEPLDTEGYVLARRGHSPAVAICCATAIDDPDPAGIENGLDRCPTGTHAVTCPERSE
ncbi:MAG: hypothetical protein KDK70_41770, partial [Myxococcales bacterium]|nr:hypothetical protein [Myxococcales bacterium]